MKLSCHQLVLRVSAWLSLLNFGKTHTEHHVAEKGALVVSNLGICKTCCSDLLELLKRKNYYFLIAIHTFCLFFFSLHQHVNYK